MTVDFNNLPCELGIPRERDRPDGDIDGGSVDQPDNVDPILRPPRRFRFPTVWVCIPSSDPDGRECREYYIHQIPANAYSVHGSKQDCERLCRKVWICVINEITGLKECRYVDFAFAFTGIGGTFYLDLDTCRFFCTNEPGGSEPGGSEPGGSEPGGSEPGGGGPGTPIGPGTPAGPSTPGPGTGPGPRTGGPGGGGGPGTGPGGGGGPGTGPGGGVSGTPAGPGTPTGPATPGPNTSGPSGPTRRPRSGTAGTITYWKCDTIGQGVVDCKAKSLPLGTGGAIQGGRVEYEILDLPEPGSCKCNVVVTGCKPTVYRYTGAQPQPSSGEYTSCSAVPQSCNKVTLTVIPNSCPEILDIPLSESTSITPIPDNQDTKRIKWKCITAVNNLGTGYTKFCVSGTSLDYTFNSLSECRERCSSSPTEMIDASPLGSPLGEVEPNTIPTNNNNDPLDFYQFDMSDIEIINPSYDFFDETYFMTEQESNFYVPIRSNLFLDLFNDFRDYRIEQLLQVGGKILSDVNSAITALSTTLIKDSLRKEISDILYNLTYPDGRPIPNSVITKTLKKHIMENTISTIDVGYIQFLKYRSIKTEDTSSKSLTLPKSRYGKTKLQITQERQNIKRNAAEVQTEVIDTQQSQTRGILRALDNAKSLDPDKYENQTKDLLRLWYILPTDINRRLPVYSGEIQNNVYVKDTNTIGVITSSGSSIELPVERLRYTVSVTTSSSDVDTVDTSSDISRAYTLPNIVEQASLFDVGSKWQTVLRVTSNLSSGLELNYGLSTPRPLYYVLKINTSTIEDVSDSDSLCTRKTKVQYTRETAASSIRNLSEFRLYPWKVFTINHNDPILGHFASDSTYEFEFTNFSLNQFGTSDGEKLFVRRIPEMIIILPTDKFNLNFFNGFSTLKAWNKRDMVFTHSPDSRYYNTGLDLHWLKIEDAYPNTDIDGQIDVFAKKGTFTGRAGILAAGYNTSAEPLPRVKHGFRAAAETASSIHLNYNVNQGLLWSDVFVRMTEQQYRSFTIGIPEFMIDKLRLGEKTGVKLLHNRNDSYIKETRILSPRSSNSQEISVKIPKTLPERLTNA